jgi:YidC/Oxa1 family membrane protein insertase
VNKRLFLYSGLIFVIILLFDAWDKETYQSPTTTTIEESIPETANDSAVPQTANDSAVLAQDAPNKPPVVSNKTTQSLVKVETDTLIVYIDLKDGSIVSSELLQYASAYGEDSNMRLLNNNGEKYIARVGLQSRNTVSPASYTTPNKNNTMGSKDTLEVVLTGKTDNQSEVIKKYLFTRNSHLISIEQTVKNLTQKNSHWRQYNTLERGEETGGHGMLPTYTGAAFYDEETKFNKIDFSDIEDENFLMKIKSGWISMIQHYFFTAWIPNNETETAQTVYTRRLDADGQNGYLIGTVGNYKKTEPSKNQVFKSSLFVGPKKKNEIENIAPGLVLTVDYGILTFLAAPLFWVLDKIYYVFGNWGWSIVMLTILIKIVFFKLSETSYKSMAKMKKLAPRMQMLKERFGDDRKKFSEALMKVYKEEKVNPLGGCFPILIQIPVFIALYWVIIESVEMRHAPFIGWINDLSSADPYFVLPVTMGITMYLQQKLNPPPTDEMQKKIFAALPFIFTFLFATFPSGLVLYWLTNNVLSIAQQYIINKRVAAL